MTASGFRQFSESPGFLLWQLSNLWQRHMQTALAGKGVTLTQFVLLNSAIWIEQSGVKVSQGLLARSVKLGLWETATAVQELERKGLVTRVAHPTDMSFLVVSVTDEGRALVQRILPMVEGFDMVFFRAVDEQLPMLMQVMQQVMDSRPYKPS